MYMSWTFRHLGQGLLLWESGLQVWVIHYAQVWHAAVHQCQHAAMAVTALRAGKQVGMSNAASVCRLAAHCRVQERGQSAVEQAEAAAQAVAEAEEAAALATRLMDVANRYEEEAQLAGGVRC